MNEAPKLFTNKPKKAQLKRSQQHKPMEFSTPPPASSSSSSAAGVAAEMGTQSSSTPPPPPQLPKESFARRYKFLWPVLLTVNLSIGAYLYMKTKKKDTIEEEVIDAALPTATVSTTAPPTAVITENIPVKEPMKLPDPIPEAQQRELFKWILEEKRKLKPKDSEEKRKIEQDKAILKMFIRAKTIPSI